MRPPQLIALYALWCAGVLAIFALANLDGYSAFATAGRPTPMVWAAGQHHK